MMNTDKLVPQLRFKGFDEKWDKKKLIDVADIIGGGTPDTTILEYWNGDIQWFTPTEIKSDFVSNSIRTISELGLKKSSAKILPIGTILLTTRATIGEVSISLIECSTNQGFQSLITKIGFNNLFLFNWIKKNKQELTTRANGSTFPEISKSEIEKILVNIPSLPEQQKIASFLSSVDEKIQQLTRKKELLEQYKKGVMQQLFSGKLRFKDGTSTELSVGNGKDYPDWEEKRLGDISSNISYGMNAAATKYDGVNKYLRITDIDESSDGLNLDKFTSPDSKLEDKFRVKVGDLLFARTGASVGKTYLYRNSDGILYFAGFLIRFHIKDAIPAFVYLNTQTSKYNKWIKVMSMRSGQPGINAEEYKSFQIKLPCLEEQQKIANFLSNIDSKIESSTQQIKQTQTFKKGLLQKMFI